jgi:hypothetical protein
MGRFLGENQQMTHGEARALKPARDSMPPGYQAGPAELMMRSRASHLCTLANKDSMRYRRWQTIYQKRMLYTPSNPRL